jgi:hypothetical protein
LDAFSNNACACLVAVAKAGCCGAPLLKQRRADLLRHILEALVPPVLVAAQPTREQRLRRHDDVGSGLDVFAIGIVDAGRRAGFPDGGIEAQAVEHAETLILRFRYRPVRKAPILGGGSGPR